MKEQLTTRISVVEHSAEHAWYPLARPEGDVAPPGEEVVVFRSADGKMSCGLWRRVPEIGRLAPPFDEIMCLLQGEVEVTTEGGAVLRVGPGDCLAAPNGSGAEWHSLSPVLKFWAVHHGEVSGRHATAMAGSGPIDWSQSSIPADDGFDPGRECVTFASGAFSTGFWERDRQDRGFERAFDEIALFLDGEAEITTESGEILSVGPGDIMITPKGSSGHWTSSSPVRKFWAIYEG